MLRNLWNRITGKTRLIEQERQWQIRLYRMQHQVEISLSLAKELPDSPKSRQLIFMLENQWISIRSKINLTMIKLEGLNDA